MTRLPSLSGLCVMLLALFSLSLVVPMDTLMAAGTKRSTVKTTSGKKRKKQRRTRRSQCSPAARAEGKRQAMDLVRTQSPDLCRMVGLQPAATVEEKASAQRLILDDAEAEATDDELQTLGIDEGEDLAELEREDDVTVDIDAFRTLWLSFGDDGSESELTDGGIEKQKIIDGVMDWLGTRYHFGGSSRAGIDCSAFTRSIFGTVASVELPRTAAQQSSVGTPITRRSDLRFGDLVFFHTRRHAYVSHVGIYLGDNLFAHASSRYGVTISSLESTYYSKRLLGGRRLSATDVLRLASSSPASGSH